MLKMNGLRVMCQLIIKKICYFLNSAFFSESIRCSAETTCIWHTNNKEPVKTIEEN